MFNNPRDKKLMIKGCVVFATILVVYNVLMLVIPFAHNGSFVASYLFGLLSIILQIGVFALALWGSDSLKKIIYAVPVIKKGFTYFTVQMISTLLFSILGTVIKGFPSWIAAVADVIILAVFVVLILVADTAKDYVETTDEKEAVNTEKIKLININIDSLSKKVEDPSAKKAVEALAELIKYSDQVSSEKTEKAEEEIEDKIGELKVRINDNDSEAIISCCKELTDMVEKRNALCKAYKSR